MGRMRILWLFVVALATLGPAWMATGCLGSRGADRIKHEIIAREEASFEAWKRKDRAFYNQYWADDMTEFLPWSPELARKAEMMPRFEEMTEKWKLASLRMIDPQVRIYGDVAVLTYKEYVTGSYEGRESRYEGKVTMIYVQERGTWRGVHYHESADGPPPANMGQ